MAHDNPHSYKLAIIALCQAKDEEQLEIIAKRTDLSLTLAWSLGWSLRGCKDKDSSHQSTYTTNS